MMEEITKLCSFNSIINLEVNGNGKHKFSGIKIAASLENERWEVGSIT